MAKKFTSAVLDVMLDAPVGTRIHVCAGEPVDYADVLARELAAAPISGSYTKKAGTPDGRASTRPAQTDIPITANGTGDHLAITNGVDTMTEVTIVTNPQALTSGGTVNTSAYDHNIPQPT